MSSAVTVETTVPEQQLGDIVVFIDSNANESPVYSYTLEETMRGMQTDPHYKSTHAVYRAGLKCGDIVWARVVSRDADARTDDETVFEQNVRIDENGARPETWPHEEYIAIACCERKRIDDLAQSIVTKAGLGVPHFRDQKTRMQQFCAATGARPMLVVEGYWPHVGDSSPIGNISERVVATGLFRTVHRDGFAAWFTVNVPDTARFIVKYATWCTEDRVMPNGWIRHGEIPAGQVGITLSHSGGITPDRWWRYALACMPGISDTQADAVASVYPTPAVLVDALRAAPTPRAATKLLQPIELPLSKLTKSKKRRKLGPVRAARICAFMSPHSD